MPDPKPTFDPAEWSLRTDGTKKGSGFLGALARPDGGVSTELSMGTEDVDGTEQEIPLLVPTLSPVEIQYLLNAPDADWQHPVMRAIAMKAVDYARQRKAAGKPFFAEPDEQDFSIAPEIQRAVPIGADAMATSRRPAGASLLEDFLSKRK